jgi:hypothetical protein
MPEASEDSAILIATSYQALKRAEQGDKSTETTNSVVVILFAGFFIEENLNVIIKEMKKSTEITSFLGGKKHPGLLDKIAWYYNYYVASPKATTRKELFAKDIKGKLLILSKLESRYPGFEDILKFRNNVAHGEINSLANLEHAKRLRKQAKSIANELFKIAAKAGYQIPRNITYQAAITKTQ